MRTGTKFIKGKDFKEFAALLSNYYPGGKVIIVAQDKEEGDALIRTLGADYNALMFSPDETGNIPAGARFVIGIGGSGVISAVKRIAENIKFAFIPSVFDYRFLYAFDGKFALPEFVFLSEKLRSEKKDYCARLYQTVFQLYTECVFRVFYASAYPYRDVTAEAYCRVAEAILDGKSDEENFYSESLRFVTNVVNEFYARKTATLITEKASQIYGVTVGERFTMARFLAVMLKNFTKHRFRGILLPSEKPVRGVKTVRSEAFDGKVLPSEEKLASYNEKISFLTDMPEPDVALLLKALSVSADTDSPVFAIINNEGITDALYYEKSERHLGISV